MLLFELMPCHDAHLSFYGKAVVGVEDGTKTLFSYQTPVARVFFAKKECRRAEVYNLQSATTLRHIREFLLQEGFVAESKRQIKKLYFVKEVTA